MYRRYFQPVPIAPGINSISLYAIPSHGKLSHLNFRPFDVVFLYNDPQLQVAVNYSYLFNLRFHENMLRIDRYISENHAILVDQF